MTATENVDSQKWYKFLLDKNEMNVIIKKPKSCSSIGNIGRWWWILIEYVTDIFWMSPTAWRQAGSTKVQIGVRTVRPVREFWKFLVFGLFGVRAVRSKWAVRPVRCSDCSLITNCSVFDLFGVRLRTLFALFGVRCRQPEQSNSGHLLFGVRSTLPTGSVIRICHQDHCLQYRRICIDQTVPLKILDPVENYENFFS